MSRRSKKSPKGDNGNIVDINGKYEIVRRLCIVNEHNETALPATSINFRWQKEPLSLVKSVAKAMGIPYQTYMKQVLYKQALEDLTQINERRRLGQKL